MSVGRPWIRELLEGIRGRRISVGVIGLGYVGLPLALLFSRKFKVVGFDKDPGRVRLLREGKSYLDLVLSEEIREATNFRPTDDFRELSGVRVYLITVPTPIKMNKEPDLRYVIEAGETVGKVLSKGDLVVLESTSYPGTTEEVLVPVLERVSGLKAGEDFGVAYSPERVDPGNRAYALEDIPKVVGGLDKELTEVTAEFYSTVFKRVVKVRDCRTAEAVKMLENIFRNVNIALVNELALIFERMGINIWEVIEAAKTKPFGFMAFYPGPGVGGHCIPVDPYYMSYRAKQFGMIPHIIELSGLINDYMPKHVVNLLELGLKKVGRKLRGAKVAVLGLSYKADVADTRESPSLKVIEELVFRGAEVRVHDPLVSEVSTEVGTFRSEVSEEDLIEWADAVIIAVNHTSYRRVLPGIISRINVPKVVVDCRNVIPTESVRGSEAALIKLGDGTSLRALGGHEG